MATGAEGDEPLRSARMAARIAGLPVSALEALAGAEVEPALDETVDAEARLHEDAERIGDGLYAAVGAASGDLRGRLVGLRRAIHNLRAPAASEWDESVAAALPDELVGDISDWLRLRDLRDDAAARLDAAVEGADEKARRALATAVGDPAFRAALRRANPELLRHAQRDDLGGAQRRARLVRYVVRTAAKTSPRQWFGSWATARVAEDSDLRWDGSVRRLAVVEPALDAVYRWLADVVEDEPEAAPVLRPVPGLWSDGDHWRFAAADGGVVGLRRTPAVDAVIERARSAKSTEELLGWLSDQTDDPEQSRDFVAQLLAAGILERRFEEADADALDRLLRGWCEVLTGIDGASDHLRRWWAAATPAPRTAEEDAEAEDSGLAEFASKGDEAPAWRDTVVAGAELVVPRRPLRDAAAALTALQQYAALWDYTVRGRRDLLALLDREFPGSAEIPLMVAYETSLRAREARQRDGGSGLFDADEMDEGFTAFERLQEASLAPALASLDQPEVDLDPSDLTGLFDAAPGYVELPSPLAVHAQLDGQAIVVNDLARGARAPARVARLLARASQPVPPGLVRRPRADGCLGLDLIAPFASNLSLRAAHDGPVLLLPSNELSPPPGREAVDPAQLVIRRRAGRAELWWPEREQRVRPHPTGMMSELWMPPFALFLMGCFAASPRKPPLLRRGARDAAAQSAAVVTLPRVTLGGGVVLERRTHVIRLDEFPVPSGGVTASDLLSVERFRRHHRLPRRGFVRVLSLEEFGRQGTVPDKTRKPLLVDLASPTLLDQVTRLARSDGVTHILLQEALPDLASHPADDSGRRRVTEFLLELPDAL